jgi:hypothetical protein
MTIPRRRERAKDARARAERLRDVTSRKLIFEIAETYDHLAERSAKLRGLLQLD